MPDSTSSRVNDLPLSPDPIQRAIDYGIDISLLEVNLSKTVEERVDQHDAALSFALELREAGRVHDAAVKGRSKCAHLGGMEVQVIDLDA